MTGMIVIEPYFFDNLRTAKRLWDENMAGKFLETSGDLPVDSEDYYEIAWDGMSSVFNDVRNYYNENEEECITVHVCFDPLIDRFYELCRAYEKLMSLTPEENFLRERGEKAVCDGFGFWDYSCGWVLYNEKHGRPRLVILFDENFCGLHILPLALAGARRELEDQVSQLEELLKKTRKSKKCKKGKPIIRLPEKIEKEAA